MKYTYRTAVRQSEALGGEPTFRVNLYADNRRVRGRGGFTSRAEAEQWGAEQCVLLKHAGPDVLPRAAGVTFAALAKLYLEAPTNSDALSGANQPLQHQNDVRWWTERLGRLPLASVDQEHVRAALQQYLDSPAHRWDRRTQRAAPTTRKPKPSSRNRKLAAVRRVFRFAMQKNMLSANPAALVDALRENNALARGLSHEQQKALLRACRHSS